MRAMFEFGYQNKNRNFAIGEICLAIQHIQTDHPQLAGKMRIVRRRIQYRQLGQIGGLWDEVCAELDAAITAELAKDPPAVPAPANSAPSLALRSLGEGRSVPPVPRKIYIFSNVKYPEENKIPVKSGDILIFLNKADSVGYYANSRCMKFIFHRSPKPEYGKPVPHCLNQYVFGEGAEGNIPKKFIEELKKSYDWNYEIEEGKIKCMTTGYMVVKWIQQKYPNCEIILVNFGYEVKNSTYRCPWHNWKFEAEDLKQFKHVNLEEKTEETK